MKFNYELCFLLFLVQLILFTYHSTILLFLFPINNFFLEIVHVMFFLFLSGMHFSAPFFFFFLLHFIIFRNSLN